MSDTRKAGRPPVAEANKAVSVTIEQRHLEMLDEAILQREGQMPDFIDDVSRDPSPSYEAREASQLAARRRKFLGDLIEQHCSFEARHPVEIKVHAPLYLAGSLAELLAGSDEGIAWMRKQEARLTAEAPASVRAGIAHNELQRLRRFDPEAYHHAIQKVLAAAKQNGDC